MTKASIRSQIDHAKELLEKAFEQEDVPPGVKAAVESLMAVLNIIVTVPVITVITMVSPYCLPGPTNRETRLLSNLLLVPSNAVFFKKSERRAFIPWQN